MRFEVLTAHVRKAIDALRRSSRNQLICSLVVFKAFYFLLILTVGMMSGGFDEEAFERSYRHWPLTGNPDWTSHFVSCDGSQYLFIAEHGYQAGSPTCAFYPLWPVVIRFFSFITAGDVFWGGLIVANCLSLGALVLLHELGSGMIGQRQSLRGILLLLAFPGALFLNVIYTESLFLFLSAALLLALRRNYYLISCICAFYLPLTKAIGIFVVVPLFVHHLRTGKPLRAVVPCLVALAGYCAYLGIMYVSTGNPFEGFHAQRYYPNQPRVEQIMDILGFLNSFFAAPRFHEITNSMIDRLFFVVFLAGLPLVYRFDKTLFTFALCVGLIPALASSLVSYSRNVMMCVPMFMAFGAFFESRDRRVAFCWIVIGLVLLQVFLVYRYVNYRWAG